ncbi:TPA: hypothetical protein ACN1CU_000317 [Escherichia coli]|uniref:hypothetical protein n=1 Tax=Escherichia TaxID=561 RepID=UPI000BB5B74F|nr:MULTISPECIES: hypothetical protein [Escherichia]EEY4479968.1 hypothetical protein [Escherichia coli O8]UVY32427.1 MAG: hypothetical protein [Bacteriophage sp.]EER1100825.1 hypothetical protein [Escherichia coli]EET1640156.1 hypothetical protein [Escherichia coli]EET9652673.1 hypothetical protein [Escherichia coli]
MLGSLMTKLKVALITLAAVFSVLVGAYTWGGRAARRAMEEKAQRETNKRLQGTVDVKNETINEVRTKDASAVHRELRDKWMRD